MRWKVQDVVDIVYQEVTNTHDTNKLNLASLLIVWSHYDKFRWNEMFPATSSPWYLIFYIVWFVCFWVSSFAHCAAPPVGSWSSTLVFLLAFYSSSVLTPSWRAQHADRAGSGATGMWGRNCLNPGKHAEMCQNQDGSGTLRHVYWDTTISRQISDITLMVTLK